MITKIFKIDPMQPNAEILKQAASILSKGGLVIIPTETVYGIAADRYNKKAVQRLYEVKNRPKDKPFSIHIDKKEKVEDFAAQISISAYKLIDAFWPGPLTLILNSKDGGTVGIRFPDNDIAEKIIGLSGVEVICPSANLSGKKPPFNFDEAIIDLNGLVDCAVDSGYTRLQAESTIVDATAEPVKIVRDGPIKSESIKEVTGKKIILFVCTGNSCRSVMAQGYLKKKLNDIGRKNVEVISAGTMMWGGQPASVEVQELLSAEGIDASSHLSQGISKSMLNKSDLILVMEKFHEQRVLQVSPQVKNRLFLLKEFARLSSGNLDILDPIGRTEEFYAATYQVIKEAIDKVVEII